MSQRQQCRGKGVEEHDIKKANLNLWPERCCSTVSLKTLKECGMLDLDSLTKLAINN